LLGLRSAGRQQAERQVKAEVAAGLEQIGATEQTQERRVPLETLVLGAEAEARAIVGVATAMDEQQKRRSARPVAPVHRHDVAARELPIGRSSSTVAVALRLAVVIPRVGDVRR